MVKRIEKTFSPLINMILYVSLLIVTPFLMLQNYLQSFIGKLSLYMLNIGSIEIPYVVILAVVIVTVLLIKNYKLLTRIRIAALLVVILLIVIGQSLSDFYFAHKFYELQHNWHYFAYAIYTYIAYKYFRSKNKTDAQIILLTFLTAVSVSTFDEFIQIHISNRIFDIGDIGKDTWGTMIGMVFIFFVINQAEMIKKKWKVREAKLRDYLKNPVAMLLLEITFTFILLAVSSQLTDIQYLGYSILISVCLFMAIFLIFHFLQKKLFKKIFIGLLLIYILVQGFFFVKYRNEGIVYNSYGITVYKGIPLLFLDVMIFENGTFRFVDKKHNFNYRDKNTIYRYATDILIIGSGTDGLGGGGFPEKTASQFVFNTKKLKPLQVIILKTPAACRKYNQLKKEGKNVIFIIHNSC